MARSPSCAKSGFPSLRTVPARCVARSMATGITLSIWMLRTRGDVADPWYTGNFDATYRDVLAGCTAMLEQL